MQHDIKKALAFIFDVDVTTSECQPCRESLYAYIDAKLDGEDPAARFPHVETHLDACVFCQLEYQEQEALLKMERETQVVAPKARLDFSYVEDIISNKPLWQVTVDDVGKRIARLSSELVVLVKKGKAIFEHFPLAAEPILQPIKDAEHEEVTILDMTDKEANVKIQVLSTYVSAERATITLRLTPLMPLPIIPRAQVMLKSAQGKFLEGASTRNNGEVRFSKVPVGQYLIVVNQKSRTWELPIYVRGVE